LEKPLTKTPPKPKLLLDECLPVRSKFPELNGYFTVKHSTEIRALKGGVSDDAVYQYACDHDLIVITVNKRHFRDLPKQSNGMSVIGVSDNSPWDKLDKKLLSYLKKMKADDWKGRYIVIKG
jgi:hypothetical protein